jgi:OTT_1508-like deaminase
MRTTSRARPQDMGAFYGALEGLAQCYEDVDSSDDEEEQHELLKNAVRKSFAISTTGDQNSLEEYLKSLRFSVAVYQSREVLEIDKIARYLGLCRDLIRFSRRPTHRPLFSNIKLELCKAPQAVQPFGSDKLCHVHGEVQLILHYEQNPHHPPSRAIGSSKSACLLCDLFIKKHGQYHISHSHKRLYDQWTIPDVHWMTKQQAIRFQDIVQAMTTELMQLRRTCSQQRRGEFNGFESRAHLLFPAHLTSAASTPSELSQRTELSPPTPMQ